MVALLRWTVAVAFISLASLAMAEPIELCVEEGAKMADKSSCTRYHICRQDEDGEFTTDIAICTSSKVFDMVTSSCVDVKSGYLQDPAGCATFYGCHKASKNSEGYIRRHFGCPGDLRFHPTEKYCTFKTMVPDKLCNSRVATQQILGEDSESTSSTTSSSTTASTTSATTTASGSTPPPTRGANDDFPKPATVTDIDRITQVIKGQLLNRRPIVNNQVSLDAASRE